MADNCKEQLRRHVAEIAVALENGVTPEECINCGAYLDGQPVCPACEHDNEGEMRAFDYLQDALDIEYRVGADREYRSAKILVACGGPNIWIDTGAEKVIGAWWGDYAEVSYRSDAMDIDGCLEELFTAT